MSFKRAGNSSAFDEILSDLHELISSLETASTKANSREAITERSGCRFNDIIEKNCVVAKHDEPNLISQDSSQGARSDLRIAQFKSRSQDNQTDNIQSNHTTFSNGDVSDEAIRRQHSRDPMENSCVSKSNHYRNAHIETYDVKNTGEAHCEDNTSEYIMVTASCKPSTSKQETAEADDEVCIPYQRDCCNSNTKTEYKINGLASMDNQKHPGESETRRVTQELDNIHRSSPVIRRKVGSVPSVLDHLIDHRKSHTLSRNPTFDLGEKRPSYSNEEQRNFKTLSLKRVFSRKFSPFRRKSKLKPTKSLPTASQQQRGIDRFSYSLEVKKEKEILVPSESSGKPTRPASLHLRHQHHISIESSPMSFENTENRSAQEFDVHPVTNNKKRKGGRFFKKSQRNRSEQSSVDSQDSDINYASCISEGTTDDSGATKESRIIYDENVVMRDKKATDSGNKNIFSEK